MGIQIHADKKFLAAYKADLGQRAQRLDAAPVDLRQSVQLNHIIFSRRKKQNNIR